jgi:hypothetical protein
MFYFQPKCRSGQIWARKFLLLASFAFITQSLHAQFYLVSQSLSENVSGWAEVPGMPATNYNASGYGASGSVFLLNPQGVVALANSSVHADFNFAPGQISFTSLAYFDTGGGINDGGTCYADADFLCSISFFVNEPVSYNYSFVNLTGSGHQATLSQSFMFGDADGTVILSQSNVINYLGVLTPGTIYTISVSEQLAANTPDPLGNEFRKELDFNLTAVQEPSSSLLLGFGALLVLHVRMWRGHHVRLVPRRLRKD